MENYKRKKEQLRKTLCVVAEFVIPLVCYQTSKFIQKHLKWIGLGQILGLSLLFFYKHYRFRKRFCLCQKRHPKQNHTFTLKCNSECIIIHHMPIYKQIQMRWSQLWGVEWFKKYWLIEGALWNNAPFPRNIDPIQQCNKIIEITHGFQKQHVHGLTLNICCLFYLAFWCKKTRLAQIYFWRVCVPLHGYAFMIHSYNLSLAQAKIELLQKF